MSGKEAGYRYRSGKTSRRDFLKLIVASGVVMSFAPFVDWGKFLPNNTSSEVKKAKIELPDGSNANVNTFPHDHAEVVIYPKAEDSVLNKEAFRAWQLIRLPNALGGDKNDVTAFRLFSMVCLHLWCLWKYMPKTDINPINPIERIACPCHGSMYDPFTGKAYAGPASLQSPPANVLPRLELEADEKGDLWVLPPTFNLRRNGIIGYGRYL